MNELKCSNCGRSSGVSGEFPRSEIGMYCWYALCPKCGEQKTNKARQAINFSERFAEFMSSVLSNATIDITGQKEEVWGTDGNIVPREIKAKRLAEKVADYAQATLDEYLKRLDGRDSDTELFEHLLGSNKVCPSCWAPKDDKGHADDCKLAKRLGR